MNEVNEMDEEPFETAIIIFVKVYKDNNPQGFGYIIYHPGPDNGVPHLTKLDGSPLEEGWVNLECYEHTVAVVPRHIQ